MQTLYDQLKTFGTDVIAQPMEDTTVLIRRMSKGLILIAWIVFLIIIGLTAITGKMATITLNVYDDIVTRLELEYYTEGASYIVAENIVQQINESRKDLGQKQITNTDSDEEFNDIEYRIRLELDGIISDESINLDTIKVDKAFIDNALPKYSTDIGNEFEFSRYVKSWLKERRDKYKENKEQENLFNTIVLLVVLGAFGSIIFLIQDFLKNESQTTIEHYMFRPLLGMFLAIGMLIVDMTAHMVISEGDITDLRRETLIILAFAAGMLSDQAYGLINEKLGRKLDSTVGDQKELLSGQMDNDRATDDMDDKGGDDNARHEP